MNLSSPVIAQHNQDATPESLQKMMVEAGSSVEKGHSGTNGANQSDQQLKGLFQV